MKISNESIKYYASLVTYYSVFRLKQLSEPIVYIYLLCFIYHRIRSVNRRIIEGSNSHFERKGGKLDRWTLRYPRSHEPVNDSFFDTLSQVDIDRVLHFVNQQCQFFDAFDHILGRYVKQEADNRALTAALIAWGTNTGLSKMGEVSDIEYHRLK